MRHFREHVPIKTAGSRRKVTRTATEAMEKPSSKDSSKVSSSTDSSENSSTVFSGSSKGSPSPSVGRDGGWGASSNASLVSKSKAEEEEEEVPSVVLPTGFPGFPDASSYNEEAPLLRIRGKGQLEGINDPRILAAVAEAIPDVVLQRRCRRSRSGRRTPDHRRCHCWRCPRWEARVTLGRRFDQDEKEHEDVIEQGFNEVDYWTYFGK
jgi:hypothetical protein